ncbi:hypothetical protein [Actinoplanes nipponensis]|nr:hypothetical protein [Actinoplanes nipponensis]
MTLWLTTTVALADPGAFWADLRLPDLLTVDVAAKQVARSERAILPASPADALDAAEQ